MKKMSINDKRKALYSKENMPVELLKHKVIRKKLIKQVIGNNGKFIKVQYQNLPVQDYAKAKVITETLLINEYMEVQVNDIKEFTYFIELLTLKNSFFAIKDKGILKWVNICKTK